MSFTSIEFAGLLLAVLSAYYFLGFRAQNWLLLAASYYFYASWDWRCLGLLVGSTAVGYGTGLVLAAPRFTRHRLAILYASNALQLAVLGLFKYYGFFARSAAELIARFGVSDSIPALDLVLPIGISFYTFHTLSYTIDVYRGDVRPTRDFVAFALFISYFPQLVAGPIARAGHLLPQTLAPRSPTVALFFEGSYLILWGLVKKVVVADNLAPVVDEAFAAPARLTAFTALLTAYAFAIQIYCDFAGYSSIARGCAHLMGFSLTRNFQTPYFSADPSEFWRRWHISLSSWLRDYLYIPLGGNRYGSAWTYCNLMVTMLLGGLWHGASWTYVLWGAYHGALLGVYRAVAPDLSKTLRAAPWGHRALHQLWFFHLTCLGWLVFRAGDFRNLTDVLAAFARPGLGDQRDFAKLALAAPVAVVEFAEYRARREGIILTLPWPARLAIYLACYLALVTLGKWQGAGFIYFQF